MYSILLIILGISFTSGEECPKVGPPSGPFDISQYLGSWYEIARTPSYFENDLDCVKATYTKRNETDIRVQNIGKNLKTGKWSSVKGDASKTDQPNWLKLSFDNRTDEFDYFIVDTDFKKYAVVFSCINKDDKAIRLGWILSRKISLSSKIFKKAAKDLAKLGIPKSELRRTDHSKSKCKQESHV
ncbi:lazarillo protein-like [Brevipalpus obovatus]|uniref:lazarillo protein-like n=1 Tax=Brevipalpus obovatus TaxID=246614 RepID=UPI003D9DC2DC